MLRPYVGGESHHNLTLSDIDQGPDADLHKLLNDDDHDDDATPDILKNQSCYYESDEVYKQIDSMSFSVLSHNIRSLSGHFESLKDSL